MRRRFHSQGGKSGGLKVQNRKIDTQKIEARFEQVRATILAHAAFFVANGSVEATWRTYRGHRLGPYFRVRCRQRSGRRAAGTGAAARPASIYLGRSPELAARVGKLLGHKDVKTTQINRRCEELHRQVRRSLTGAKQELRRLLAERGAVQRWFERSLRASGKKGGRARG